MSYWNNKRVAVLGGAALIGSHLTEQLLELGANVTVIDNLSSGNAKNIHPDARFHYVDLMRDAVYPFVEGRDVVFHLACQHGGRGYVDTHKLECYQNLALDGNILRGCAQARVPKLVFASSACVYPMHIQQDRSTPLRLTEDLVNEQDGMRPDGAYGWSKLSCEFALNAYAEQYNLNWLSTRFFTVYGPRMKENHAICALIAKTFIGQDPFEIWGDGKQIRNWTYVEDTARGMILAAEKMKRGAVNIGVEDEFTPNLAVEHIWNLMGWVPNELKYIPTAPTGPLNRVADATKAHKELGWFPKISFTQGLRRTIDWYVSTHDVGDVRASLQKALTER